MRLLSLCLLIWCAVLTSACASDETGGTGGAENSGGAGTGGQDDGGGGASQGCTGDEVECGGACVDITSDVDHCGGCDSPCEEEPNSSVECITLGGAGPGTVCSYKCDPGFTTDQTGQCVPE